MSSRRSSLFICCAVLAVLMLKVLAQDHHDAGDGKSQRPEPAETFVKCDMQGTLYGNLTLGESDHAATYILANGTFWELNLDDAKVSQAEVKRISGRQVRVRGTLSAANPAAAGRRRVLDVIDLLPVPGADPKPDERGGPRSKPYIRGYIITRIPGGPKDHHREKLITIHLPGVQVFLTDPVTRGLKSRTTTDLSGRFDFPPQPPGTYQLCWRAKGFVGGCRPALITVTDQPVYVGDVAIPIERREHDVSIYGRVTARDRRGPRWFDPLDNINALVRIAAVDAKGVTHATAYVNNSGDYLLPQVPDFEHLQLRAEVEGGSETRSIRSEILQGGPRHRLDIVLSNRSPRIGPIVPKVGGERARSVAPGTTLDLSAPVTDPEGDALTYHWSVPPGSGSLTDKTTQDTKWVAPANAGDYDVTLIVRDQQGGYAQSSVRISTHEGVVFSGRVVEDTGPPAVNAVIEVNGQQVTTNANGYFRLRAKDSNRFVFNIRKPGYALLSRIYLEGVTGQTWELSRASVRSVDPTQPIDVTDPRQKEVCELPFSARVEWAQFPEQRRPRIQDGTGSLKGIGDKPFREPILERLAARRGREGCGPGVRVQIPADSLVDADGNPPAGNVDLSLFTVDLLAQFDMPGDYTVAEPGGTQVMESWGAGLVEITQGPRRYNLKPGTTATMTIPIADIQLLDARAEPDTIPLLTYDETEGVWRQTGEAKRDGNAYVAEVKSFSAINTDLVKQNQSCVRIHSPQATPEFPQGLPPSYNLEITIPQGAGAAPRVLTTTVDNSVPYHVIYNLPSNVNIVLVPFSVDNPSVPFGTFIVNTGEPQDPTDPNRPEYPYGACHTEVVLYDVGLPEPPTDAFLHGLFTFAATNLDELDPANADDAELLAALDLATTQYYTLVDPRNLRETLDEFLDFNGFAGTAVNAKYVNAADLGFGRDMYAVKRLSSDGQFDYAFAVSNYGGNADDPGGTPDLEDFQQMFDGVSTPFATVCMEYSRIENEEGGPDEPTDPERVMKFFVYNGAGTLVNAAKLDAFGARPIPQLCVVCHGGTIPYPGAPFVTDGDVPAFSEPDDVKMGSVFLPFDLGGLSIFDGAAPAGFTKADQQDEIKQLNQFVRESQPGIAIEEMVDAMYPGSAAVQVEEYTVNDWGADAANAHFYKTVIAKSCRMCHVARPLEVGRDIRFREFGPTLALEAPIELRVCGTKQMPHAHITFKRFWGSQDPAGTSLLYPYQPAQLIAWGQTFVSSDYAAECAAPPPPDVPPVLDYGQIQAIFDSNCVACHTPGGFAGFLPLDPGVAHGNIVNVPASQLATMDLIEPGDPANSYLLHKLKGTQGDVGGSGGQMPLGGPALSDSEIDLVEQWIVEGAPGP